MRKDNVRTVGVAPVEATPRENTNSRKTRAVLASLAVLGLGAGLTMAAWTDNVTFTRDVTIGEEGSLHLLGAVGENGSVNVPDGVWENEVTIDGLDLDGAQTDVQRLWVKSPVDLTVTGDSPQLTVATAWSGAAASTIGTYVTVGMSDLTRVENYDENYYWYLDLTTRGVAAPSADQAATLTVTFAGQLAAT